MTFCTVVEVGSFSKSARKLSISAPVVTRNIVYLEKIYRVALFHRTTRSVVLTANGKTLYQYAKSILDLFEESKDMIELQKTNPAGFLKIGVSNAIHRDFVLRYLNILLKDYPDLRLSVNSNIHGLNFSKEGLDFIITSIVKPLNTDVYVKKLGFWKSLICASPDYIARCGSPQSFNDLKRYNCLSHLIDRGKWRVMEKGILKRIPIQGNLVLSNSSDLRIMGINGMGIICVPDFTVAEDIKKGRLIEVLKNKNVLQYDIYVVYTKKIAGTKRGQVFLNFLEDVVFKKDNMPYKSL